MAITAKPYAAFFTTLLGAQTSPANDPMNVALLAPSYTPNIALHADYGAVSGNEITGTGYTAGGKELPNWAMGSYDGTLQGVTLTADNLTWATLTATVRYAVYYFATSQQLVALVDLGENKSATAQDFTLSFPNGVLRLRTAS